MSTVITKIYRDIPHNQKEVLRYAGCNVSDNRVTELLNSCINEIGRGTACKVCYRLMPVKIEANECDFGDFKVFSKDLAKNLNGCSRALLFAATVGIEWDRLITKYCKISPVKAVMFQALGAERIESLCDVFCDEMVLEYKKPLKPRFSPGYGDLALETQKEIFAVLQCSKQIGIFLNDSLLITPTKSVTAFVGICDTEKTV